VTIYANGVSQCSSPYSVTSSGSSIACNVADNSTVRITSDIPVIVHNHYTAANANYEHTLYPVNQTRTQEGMFVFSSNTNTLLAGNASTDYSYIGDTQTSATTGTISANSSTAGPATGAGGQYSFNDGPYKIKSTNSTSLMSNTYGDGDGTGLTPGIPRTEFGTVFGVPKDVDFYAAMSDQAAFCTVYTVNLTTGALTSQATQTLASSNSEVYGLPTTGDFGTGNSTVAYTTSSVVVCDKPAAAVMQTGVKETNIWTPATNRQFTYPSPSVAFSESEEKTPYPISFWKFDEGAENTCSGGTNDACDSAAGKNDGTNTATRATETSCVSGKCLSFDGTDDVVTIANDSDIDFDIGLNDGISVSFWINASSSGENDADDYGEIFKKGNHFYCQTRPGSSGSVADIYCTIDLVTTDATVTIDDAVTIGAWHHIEATYANDGDDDLQVYVDGLLRATGAGDGAPAGTDSSSILIGGDTSNNFHGYIDEVKIFGYERTAAQVKTDYIEGASGAGSNVAIGIGGTTMPSPNLWWRFDEGTGTTANNSGSNGSTYNGTVTSGTWTLSGKYDKALTFTASSSVADTITDPGSTNSLSLWVYPTTSAASKNLITSGKLTTDASSRPIYGTCTGTALALNTWTHIAVVSAGAGSCALYQNGVLTSSNTTGVTFGTSFNVGASSFTGKIDDAKLYTVALTADQVKVDMNNASTFSVATDQSESALLTDGSAISSLAGYWTMNENKDNTCVGGTNDVCDLTPNGNNGASTGGPTWIPGKFGSALNFSDGSSQYVNIGDVLNVLDSQDFSASGWFYWVKGTTHDAIFSKYNNVGWRFYISVSSDKAIFEVDDGPDAVTIVSTPTITQNQWYHFAIVYDDDSDTNTSIWLNGQKVASATGVSNVNSLSNTGHMRIGAINAGASFDYFNGRLDDIKFFTSALTPAQINYEYNRGLPIAWYRLDECLGTTINDSSGTGLTGTLTIGTSGTNTLPGNCLSNTSSHAWFNGRVGKVNASLSFDDSDDYVTVPDNNALDLTSRLTLAAWVKTAANEANNVIVSKGSSYEMGVTATGALYWDGAGAQVDDGKTLVGSGNWHHVAITNDDTTATYYVDGVQTGTSAAGIDADNATALYIGYDGANYFDGLIDDVRVFNYPLSATQVQQVMNGGAVRFE
jgi:hypothetical protein